MDYESFLAEWRDEHAHVLVHTSGSTGTPKPMWVEKRRMEASARATCRFLGLKAGDVALLCLPLDYIAGKMMVVRALTCGLRLVSVPPTGHPLAQCPENIDFAAMVPMQVYNSLHVPEERERLRHIRHLIIGGGAIDDALAEALKTFENGVWSTYGMTETLSHIALRRLSGPDATEWYTPLEGVTLSLTAEGCLAIDAPALADGQLVTNDIAELLADGRFRILGRLDNTICTGGVKVQAEAVEALLSHHLAAPFCITKRRDEKYGEVVVLLTESTDTGALKAICQRVLPKYWQPRHIISVGRIPLTATGKIARKEAMRLAALT